MEKDFFPAENQDGMCSGGGKKWMFYRVGENVVGVPCIERII